MNTSDFVPVSTGIAGATVAAVSGSGTTYTVTVVEQQTGEVVTGTATVVVHDPQITTQAGTPRAAARSRKRARIA